MDTKSRILIAVSCISIVMWINRLETVEATPVPMFSMQIAKIDVAYTYHRAAYRIITTTRGTLLAVTDNKVELHVKDVINQSDGYWKQ